MTRIVSRVIFVMHFMTDFNAVESWCSKVLTSLLGLLSTSELVGALRSILESDENEV